MWLRLQGGQERWAWQVECRMRRGKGGSVMADSPIPLLSSP